jgi:hypothetical protein
MPSLGYTLSVYKGDFINLNKSKIQVQVKKTKTTNLYYLLILMRSVIQHLNLPL